MTSAVDRAFHGLRHMIATGRIGAGERLPPEGDLCEQLAVSRGSLREAVRMLAALRVLEPRHGSGTYVSALEPEDIIGSLSLTVELLPLSGVLEVYEIRRVLEAHVTAQAAARRTPEELESLRALVEGMEATDDPAEVSALDHRFHAGIARIAGNPALGALIDVFRTRSRKYQMFTLPEGAELKRRSDADHRVILAALADRDPAAAAAAAQAHVAQTERWLRAFTPPPVEEPEGGLPGV
ncbi:FCD domain-containing protein [Streptomyces sp. NPDC051940]|uniref:FadR/GntR family transcriptional regulator n=1 Tax=Streptomyces sp. NPDC051940 TaxID=3155675 RepID=UPI00344A25DF